MEVNYFTILYWFCHTSTCICHRYTRVPPSWTPPPSSLPVPSLWVVLYARQQKRHRCIEQSFGLGGRGRGWDDLGEWHYMYNIIYETNRQSRFNEWYRMLGTGALRWPRGMVRGGRRERGSGWGNTCIPVADTCWCMAKPIQYCKVINVQLK